jgi:hypothetical protein
VGSFGVDYRGIQFDGGERICVGFLTLNRKKGVEVYGVFFNNQLDSGSNNFGFWILD